jgi:hypothetical protein
MRISQFTIQYLKKPFVIWSIIFNFLLRLIETPEIFGFISWILESQIYLVIFFTSFVHAYLQQMLPVLTTWRQISEKQRHDKWTIPNVMTNRFVMNIALWLSGVLFFSGLLMSFGILYPQSIPDFQTYDQTRVGLQIVGLGLFALTLYYSREFEKLLKKYEIKTDEKENLGILIYVIFIKLCFCYLLRIKEVTRSFMIIKYNQKKLFTYNAK